MDRTDTLVIRPEQGFASLQLGELWRYRELLGFLAWRDIRVRYKQSVLGVLWALITPVVTMAIFTVIFGRVARIPSDGVPYPIFCFLGLLPWLFFSQSLQRATASMVAERGLLTKVYFPRLIVPVAATVAPLVELAIASSVLFAMMAWYAVVPALHALYLAPLCIGWAWLLAIGAGTLLSAVNVHYRDVGQMIPFLIQVWMYASPVVYPASMFPDAWRSVLSLNPMVGVIEGLRFAVLGHEPPPVASLAVSACVSLLLLATGVLSFKRMERTFSDVV